MGMTAIGICLWRYAMRYSPMHPGWFNRDRFLLSNGHTCLLQYVFMHYAGYPDMTMDQLRSYHSERTDSLCPGHPEIENPGIEVSTGPLGQGIANAVGLAMAGKHLASVYNRDEYRIVDNTIWCVVGDACLQEGVALEAISLAGEVPCQMEISAHLTSTQVTGGLITSSLSMTITRSKAMAQSLSPTAKTSIRRLVQAVGEFLTSRMALKMLAAYSKRSRKQLQPRANRPLSISKPSSASTPELPARGKRTVRH